MKYPARLALDDNYAADYQQRMERARTDRVSEKLIKHPAARRAAQITAAVAGFGVIAFFLVSFIQKLIAL